RFDRVLAGGCLGSWGTILPSATIGDIILNERTPIDEQDCPRFATACIGLPPGARRKGNGEIIFLSLLSLFSRPRHRGRTGAWQRPGIEPGALRAFDSGT